MSRVGRYDRLQRVMPRSSVGEGWELMAERVGRRVVWVAVLVAVALGLGGPASASASARPEASDDRAAARHATVGTYNVDFGTNLAPLFAITDPVQLMTAANDVYQDMVASNYAERADTIADLVAKERPDVLGLQEIATWETFDRTHPELGFLVAYDFEPLLLTALAERGVPYTVAVANVTFQGSMPTSPTTVAGSPTRTSSSSAAGGPHARCRRRTGRRASSWPASRCPTWESPSPGGGRAPTSP